MRVRAYLSIGYPTAQQWDYIEIDDEELEGLSEQEREELIDREVHYWAQDFIEYGWE